MLCSSSATCPSKLAVHIDPPKTNTAGKSKKKSNRKERGTEKIIKQA
jgi:hypothetical protein